MAYWRLSDRAQIVPGPPEQAQEQAAGGNGDEQASGQRRHRLAYTHSAWPFAPKGLIIPKSRYDAIARPRMTTITLTSKQLTAPRDFHLSLDLSDQLTVTAWIHAEEYRPETVQVLAAQWQLTTSFDAFSGFDASHTDGLACKGYMGGICDGRYIYFSPNRDGNDRESVHGRVLRYDTHGNFHDPTSYAAYDVEHVTGLRTVNYYGTAFDGRHVFFSPQDEGHQYHSRVLRYHTCRPFKDPASWDAFDVGMIHSHQGIAFDGRYIYFPPGYEGSAGYTAIKEDKHSGKIVRYDTHSDFKDHQSWQTFDSKTLSARTTNFDGGAFDGRHIYFVPLSNGCVLRYDTCADFADPRSWQHFDIGRFKKDGWYVGAVFDGRFLYFVSYAHSTIVRFDTEGDFQDPRNWRPKEVKGTADLDTGGFDGGICDGRYVYFIPWTNSEGHHHCNVLRYDTLGDFDDPAAWSACDAGHAAGIDTIGYNGGAFDGRFLYGAPVCDDNAFHGRILRYDTLAEGAFVLKCSDYGHNGGLSAAVPGPSFIVNCEQGPIGVAAHQRLAPGRHYIAGVYNGRRIKLFIDGKAVSQQTGSGRLRRTKIPVSIGQLAGGTALFRGIIDEITISDTARADDWLLNAYGERSTT